MNKNIRIVFFLIGTIILFTDCRKFETYDCFFYTDIENSTGPLTLTIDDLNLGDLPLLKNVSSPSSDTIFKKAVHLSLKHGRYKIEAIDNNGKSKCSGTLKLRFNSHKGSTDPGVLDFAQSGNILVIRIHFD
jgi:hypothetical protein